MRKGERPRTALGDLAKPRPRWWIEIGNDRFTNDGGRIAVSDPSEVLIKWRKIREQKLAEARERAVGPARKRPRGRPRISHRDELAIRTKLSDYQSARVALSAANSLLPPHESVETGATRKEQRREARAIHDSLHDLVGRWCEKGGSPEAPERALIAFGFATRGCSGNAASGGQETRKRRMSCRLLTDAERIVVESAVAMSGRPLTCKVFARFLAEYRLTRRNKRARPLWQHAAWLVEVIRNPHAGIADAAKSIRKAQLHRSRQARTGVRQKSGNPA